MTDKLSAARRSDNMRKIPATNTSPELSVRRLIHSMGFRYRLHVAKLPGKPDIVLPRLNKIIEVRGCFWHQHGRTCIDSHIPKSRIDYWKPKLERNRKRDALNLRRLRALGFTVLVIWECEVKDERSLRRKLSAFLTG